MRWALGPGKRPGVLPLYSYAVLSVYSYAVLPPLPLESIELLIMGADTMQMGQGVSEQMDHLEVFLASIL